MGKIRNVAIACLLAAEAFLSAEVELLKVNDISRIMQQIFSQHVDKKEISTDILKHAFRVYIDQFDPERIYLLNSEVHPYMDMDDTTVNKDIEKYRKENFEAFEKLNGIIQNAIFRARGLRRKIEKDREMLFHTASKKVGKYEEWSDPDLKISFPKGMPELQQRITQHLVRFINAEKRRYGEKKIVDNQVPTLDIYNKHLINVENQYLYVDEAGQPLTPALKENLFTFHVLKALASSLDAHTTVLNPAEAYDMRVRLEKEFRGVGLGIKQENNGSLIISSLVEGSPAAKNGQVDIGDRLIEVNGKNVDKMPVDKAIELLRNAPGNSVKLVLKKSNAESNATYSVELNIEAIAVVEDRVEVTSEPFEGGIIGKITLHSFYQGANGISSENDIKKALVDLSKKGSIKGLILDLRENSGGFLTQAVKVAGLFITNGVVVVSKYANGEEHFYRDMNNKVYYGGPLVVLTSKATASAAEIVAQALQDYGVALVVGDEHTYGKGTIQSQTVTGDHSTSYFKVTVGKYYTASGKTPQIQGVKADIVVPSPFISEHIGEEYLEYSLKSDTIPASFDDQLTDIDPNVKAWYLHYYTPTLQHRVDKWKNMLAILKQNTTQRLSQNSLYKQFIASERADSEESDKIRKQYWVDDVQMQEAVSVIKDMVSMEGSDRGAGKTADGSLEDALPGK